MYGNYGAVRTISAFFVVLAWILIIIGSFIAMLGLFELVANATSQGQNPFGVASGTTTLISGFSLAFSGFLMLAFGQAIRLFVDIAVNTSRIAEHTAATVSFFGRVANRGAQAQQPIATESRPSPYADSGVYEGVAWQSFADGRVSAKINGEVKEFQSGNEFTRYVHASKTK
jgi:hypothetical protein